MESFFRSIIFKAFAIYWGAIICLVYFAKWVDKNSHYIELGLLLIGIGIVVSVVSVLAYRIFRRW